MRQKYHILKLRAFLRFLISTCLTCRMRRARPIEPLMASLPKGRLAFRQRPFSHCGLDYFGPMYVKVKRSREKRWGALFTCLTTRAIYLEVAHSLNASSAIMALQRLSARRGSPSVIYSDNENNFRGLCTELSQEVAKINKNKQYKYALKNGMKWLFNPRDSPHMGGAWERLVRTVKIALHATLNDETTTDEVLLTVLAKIEHSVNSRPLTHVSIDSRDKEALTPNHFLIGTFSGAIKLSSFNEKPLCSRKDWCLS